jgi:Outer membrane protein beta-barrel domain
MADHQFEQNVSQQLADFKLKPNAEVWQQVQMQLEEDRKRRRWFFYLPIAALFIGGLLYAVWPTEEPANTATVARTGTNKSTATTTETTTNESPLTKTGSSTAANESATSAKEEVGNNLQQQPTSTSSTQQNNIVKKQVNRKINSANKFASPPTMQSQTNKEEITSEHFQTQKETPVNTATVSNETKQQEQKSDSAAITQLVIVNTDSATADVTTTVADTTGISTPALLQPTIKKKVQLGVHLNVGLSDIRGSLFPGSGYKSFSDASPLGVNYGAPGGVTRIVQYDYAIKPSPQIGIGVLLRKPFKKRHSFVTGLQYQFSSYTVTQRQRIDSFMAPTNMFSNISTKEKTVQFRMHALNVPLELEFKIADIKKGRLLFGAGIHNWFVVSSTQTDTLSAFRYAATTDRTAGYNGITNPKETKATTYQPQLYLSPSFEWRGKKTSSQLGLYLDYGLRPAYKSTVKDYWWQTGIRYRIFFNR